MVTPFGRDSGVDLDTMGKLIDFNINNGIAAIAVCATTGESPTLSDSEKRRVISYAVRHVDGRVPVIAGTGSNDTAHVLGLARFAAEEGADAQLVVTPYYNKTTQKGLAEHYEYIADRTDLPIILYNVPSRTGMNILPQTYRRLSLHPNIVGVKEASGDVAAAVRIKAMCGDGLDLYSGDDSLITALLAVGAKGVISVLSNVTPDAVSRMCRLWSEGRQGESTALQIRYSELIDALFAETNPIPVKQALRLIGLDCGGCRMPLCEPEKKTTEQLSHALAGLGLIPKQ